MRFLVPEQPVRLLGLPGPAVDANVNQMREIMKKYGFSEETMLDRLECFGGFAEHAAEMRKTVTAGK